MNYFLFGSETYLLQLRRREIIRDTLGDDQENVSLYYGKNWNMDDVIMDCQSMSFLSDRKVVILENPEFLVNARVTDEENVSKLIRYLKAPNEDTTFILYSDQDFDRRKKAVSDLSKLLHREVFDTLKEEEFSRVVRNDLRENRLDLNNECFNELISRLPLDIANWKTELAKLLLYPGKITRDVISDLVSRPIENDTFQLSSAVVGKDVDKALRVYYDLLVNYKNNLQPIIGLLASQFRNMCMCRTLNEQGYSAEAIAERLNHKPFWATMCLRNSTGTDSLDLLKILAELSQLDQDIKTGKVEAVTGLELFIIRNTKRGHGIT